MTVDLENQVKKNIKQYLFFWNEWIRNGNCNLDPYEIKLIEACINGDVKSTLSEDLSSFEIIERWKQILLKLELGHQVFKDFVIVNFLQTIVDLGKAYGYDSFLNTPVRQLNIDEDLKLCLLKLKTHTLQVAFIVYKPEDFNRRWLYDIIVEFQNVYKAKSLLSITTITHTNH